MLILELKHGEGVSIFEPEGNLLGRIIYTEQRGHAVRLGFNLPGKYKILRDTILAKDCGNDCNK